MVSCAVRPIAPAPRGSVTSGSSMRMRVSPERASDGLRDTERVDAPAQHLERAVGRLGVRLGRRAVAGLEREGGAAAQVEPQAGLLREGEVSGGGEDDEREERAPQRGT
jgi:hypothetical protein